MTASSDDEIRTAVREHYAHLAATDGAGCGCQPGCCGTPTPTPDAMSRALGYSAADLLAVPEGANLGLGCGNPRAIAALRPGETVLDLGSGAGFDCFLAAAQVGGTGRVIGIDMTPEMIAKARANARAGGYGNVEFRLGEIENLPVADGIADVAISNCVINLSPDKPRVYGEVYRALKPGGRLAISDVVAFAELPEAVRRDLALRAGCINGAATIAELTDLLEACGFASIRIEPKDESRAYIRDWAPGTAIEDYVVSANVLAVKPQTPSAPGR